MFDSNRYRALLEEMTRQADQLEQAILAERTAMAGYDNEQIKARLTDKLTALKSLEGNIEQRQALLSGAGFAPGEGGHAALLESLDPQTRDQIEQAAITAEAAILRCQNENQGNAAVLQRIKKKADSIKSIIAGSEGQVLYGAKGKTTTPKVGRALGSA